MKCIFPLILLGLAGAVMGETVAKKPAAETPSSKTANPSKTDSSTPSKSSTTAQDSEGIKEGPETNGPPVAAVSSIDPEDIQGFEHYAPQIQALIRKCLGLTQRNLTYSFGSADPKNGGMDCSGTIYFVLHDFGFKGVPRQSNEMAEWVEDKTLLYRVDAADSLSHAEFSSLQPGNLLFWSGTYDAGPRKTPVTHVMLYLGKLKSNGKHIVFGASDGRAYQGKRRTGVSVFDFSLPKSASTAKFYGYGMIPGVGKIDPPKPEPKPAPAPVVASQPAAAIKTQSGQEKKVAPTPAPTAAAKKQEVSRVAETAAKPRSVPVIVVAEAGPKPSDSLAVKQPVEEVRPAIRVEPKVASQPEVAQENKPVQVASSSSKTLNKSSASPAKTTSSVKKTTTSSSSQKSKPVVKRKPAPPPPTPIERAQRAAKNFFENVKRSFP